MRRWTTKIHAIKPSTGELVEWCGPVINVPSWKLAQEYCENNGLGYCQVDGELIMEIPCKEGSHDPDWNKSIDYETIQNN